LFQWIRPKTAERLAGLKSRLGFRAGLKLTRIFR
jgi:hypothetical protein